MSSAIATFDALTIVEELENTSQGASDSEVSAFAYLACVLSLYAGRAADIWGYEFAATAAGAPVSAALTESLADLRVAGFVGQHGPTNRITAAGKRNIEEWRGWRRFQNRREFLLGACGSSLFLPTALVTDSLTFEPQLRAALALSSTRSLLDEAGSLMLQQQLDVLRAEVGVVSDPLVPAVIWLRYLTLLRGSVTGSTLP